MSSLDMPTDDYKRHPEKEIPILSGSLAIEDTSSLSEILKLAISLIIAGHVISEQSESPRSVLQYCTTVCPYKG